MDMKYVHMPGPIGPYHTARTLVDSAHEYGVVHDRQKAIFPHRNPKDLTVGLFSCGTKHMMANRQPSDSRGHPVAKYFIQYFSGARLALPEPDRAMYFASGIKHQLLTWFAIGVPLGTICNVVSRDSGATKLRSCITILPKRLLVEFGCRWLVVRLAMSALHRPCLAPCISPPD